MTQELWPKVRAQKQSQLPEKQSMSCPYVLSKNVLGTGSYANVYECKNSLTGAHYAAKRFSKKLVYGKELMLQREFQVLRSILRSHPNILLMVDHFETSKYFFLVTELAEGGELFDRITRGQGKIDSAEARQILLVLLNAIDHLHSNQIAHRDIKAENILFASKNFDASLLLLADFGQARILAPGEKAQSIDGTLSYLAPEALSNKGHSFPVDVWAVGVLTYFMLSGYMPFDCDTESETKKFICEADYVFEPKEYWEDIPDSAKQFISECFEIDPNKRITIQKALSHPFIRSADISLKSAFSFNSLQHLHDKVSIVYQSREILEPAMLSRQNSSDSSSIKLSSTKPNANTGYPIKSCAASAKCSVEDSIHILEGEKCFSPETVTRFSTPVTSALISRQLSLKDLDPSRGLVLLENKASSKLTELGKAEFSI